MASAVLWRRNDEVLVLLTSVTPHNKVFARTKEHENACFHWNHSTVCFSGWTVTAFGTGFGGTVKWHVIVSLLMCEILPAFKFIVVISNSSFIESCKNLTKSVAELSCDTQCNSNYLYWEMSNGFFCIQSGWDDSAVGNWSCLSKWEGNAVLIRGGGSTK